MAELDIDECMIDELQSYGNGITAGDLKKIQDAGISSCYTLMENTNKRLAELTGLNDTKIYQIALAIERMEDYGVLSGRNLLLISCKGGGGGGGKDSEWNALKAAKGGKSSERRNKKNKSLLRRKQRSLKEEAKVF